MFSKILQQIGFVACIALVVACFMPWAYYADIKETFTGFYSFQNNYGKPGKFLTLVAIIAFVLMYLPKVWAKRTNLFVCALGVGYAIKSYILFTSCYNAYCPEKEAGVYLMLIATIIMLLSSIFPDLKMKDKKAHTPQT
ncbi:MAG: hypothetical protein IPP72_08385 [Chitinophagaceae bacterium]|nr:hypothetical protein [Chitinophagaceae bacterium]